MHIKKGMVKWLVIIFILALTAETSFVGVYAKDTGGKITASKITASKDTDVKINSLRLNAQPKVVNGAVLVPLRPVFESLGWKVSTISRVNLLAWWNMSFLQKR